MHADFCEFVNVVREFLLAVDLPGLRHEGVRRIEPLDNHILRRTRREVQQSGLIAPNLLRQHKSRGHVGKGFNPIAELTGCNAHAVDVRFLRVAQQILLQELRSQPNEPLCAVGGQIVEAPDAFSVRQETRGLAEASDNSSVVIQENVTGTDGTMDEALLVQILQSMEDILQDEHDYHLREAFGRDRGLFID